MASANDPLRGLKMPAAEQRLRYGLATKLLIILAIGALMLGGLFGTLGVLLVYLGAKGDSTIKLFGQNLSTGNVGVASLFVAAVTVIVMSGRILTTFRHLVKVGSSENT